MTQSLTNVLFGMGNPLLDISSEVKTELLEKYGLQANNAILAEDKHIPLYKEMIKDYKVDFIAGGASQNSVRGAQWMLPAGSTTFMGCVGKDEYADIMKKAAVKNGVRVQYMVQDEKPTGTCAVLITGKDRSLVANLSAANLYKVDHLKQPENWKHVENARYYYISGFFLTVSPESILEVAKHACGANKVFCMNLSAPFLCQFFKDQMSQCIEFWDFIFGNETEAAAFSEAHGFGTNDVKEIAIKISAMPKKNSSRPRVVVITQGSQSTIVAQNGEAKEYAINPISSDDIIDTNGAGDAFVGGFLSQLVQNKPIEKCVDAGHYLARIVIQRSGATFPETQCEFQ